MSDQINGALAYLATPYTKYKPGIEQAFVDAAKLAALLLRAGMKVYSPIAHTHPLAIHGKIDPLDHAIWMPFDQAMMTAADVLLVAHMEGWQESYGVAYEIKFFEDAGKPIFDLDPKTLRMERRRALVYEPARCCLRGPECRCAIGERCKEPGCEYARDPVVVRVRPNAIGVCLDFPGCGCKINCGERKSQKSDNQEAQSSSLLPGALPLHREER